MQKALKLLADGKADTLVVSTLSRLTRQPGDWEHLLDLIDGQGWTVKAADFDIDLATTGGRLIARILISFLGFEYEEKVKGYNNARQNAVLNHGVHGGDVAPLGYSWTVRGSDKAGNEQRGPLTPNKDAARVVAGFEARASDDPAERAWSNIIRLLGVKSQGNASSILKNRVYLGEARSGQFVKPNAHPALVSEELFRRANRREWNGHLSATVGWV